MLLPGTMAATLVTSLVAIATGSNAIQHWILCTIVLVDV